MAMARSRKKRPRRGNALEVERRRREVERLRGRGLAYGAIAAQLGVNVSTVQRDLAAVREANAGRSSEQGAGRELAAEILAGFNELRAELRLDYLATAGVRDEEITPDERIRLGRFRLRQLDAMQKMALARCRVLVALGLLPGRQARARDAAPPDAAIDPAMVARARLALEAERRSRPPPEE
jgi:transposase